MDADVINQILACQDKKYIYGMGNLGQHLYKKLTELGVHIDGYVVDYVDINNSDVGTTTIPVFLMDKVLEKEVHFGSLIIGFASGYEKVHELRGKCQFGEVYELAIPFDHHSHFSVEWVEDHKNEIKSTCKLLEDELSERSLLAFLNSISQQDVSYVRDVFDVQRTYFSNEIISINDEEVFLEIGAYKGKSIIDFHNLSKGYYKKIIGIEPDVQNFESLVIELKNKKIDAELHNIGCWYEKTRLCFDSEDKISRVDENGNAFIDVDTLDNIVGNDVKVSLINLGVSISTEEILLGGKNIIEKNKPQMIIFLGSSDEGLFRVPKLLKQIRSDYRLYMRFTECMPSRFFLLAK